MKRDKNLHPLSFEHHIALTSVVNFNKACERGEGADFWKGMGEQYQQWRRLSLEPHLAQEERLLRDPLCDKLGADHPLIIRFDDEHRQLRDLMDALERALATGEDLVPHLKALTTLLEAHVRFEERQLFPVIEEQFSEAQLCSAGDVLWRELPETVVTPGGNGCPVPYRNRQRP